LHFRDFSIFDFCQKIFLPSHSIAPRHIPHTPCA
jgi:hypothetical protein